MVTYRMAEEIGWQTRNCHWNLVFYINYETSLKKANSKKQIEL